jgi:hypothetical protein
LAVPVEIWILSSPFFINGIFLFYWDRAHSCVISDLDIKTPTSLHFVFLFVGYQNICRAPIM